MACSSKDSCACKNNAPQDASQNASQKQDSYGAVALPARQENNERQPLLWQTSTDVEANAPSTHCDVNNPVRGGRCCRDLKGEEEARTLIDPDTIRDIIIGLSDGLTVPFALTAGLSSVGSSKLVVIAGVAELTSGAISMAIGGYLSAQAEKEHYDHSESNTADRVAQSCNEQLQTEVLEILEPYGIVGPVAAQVAAQLQQAEQTKQARITAAQDEQDASRGLTPFLVRLGQGLEPVSSERSFRSALHIGVSYFGGGLIPLAPYFFLATAFQGLIASSILTGITLLLFGIAKHRVTGGEESARSYAWSAVSTLTVGGAAAASSWLIVKMLEGPDSL